MKKMVTNFDVIHMQPITYNTYMYMNIYMCKYSEELEDCFFSSSYFFSSFFLIFAAAF